MEHLLKFSKLPVLHETHLGNDDLPSYVRNRNTIIDKDPDDYHVNM